MPARSMTIVAQIQQYVGPIDQDWRVCDRQCAFSQSWRQTWPSGRQSRMTTTPVIAPQGLSLDSADPIRQGETRTVRVTAIDALWATQRLDGLIRDADSRMGGLLFLYDANGKRHIASISTAVIPKFD